MSAYPSSICTYICTHFTHKHTHFILSPSKVQIKNSVWFGKRSLLSNSSLCCQMFSSGLHHLQHRLMSSQSDNSKIFLTITLEKILWIISTIATIHSSISTSIDKSSSRGSKIGSIVGYNSSVGIVN